MNNFDHFDTEKQCDEFPEPDLELEFWMDVQNGATLADLFGVDAMREYVKERKAA